MATHLLTSVGELPVHTHTVTVSNQSLVGTTEGTYTRIASEIGVSGICSTIDNSSNGGSYTGVSKSKYRTKITASHSHNATVQNTGSNQEHNNIMPYIGVYIWRRTA